MGRGSLLFSIFHATRTIFAHVPSYFIQTIKITGQEIAQFHTLKHSFISNCSSFSLIILKYLNLKLSFRKHFYEPQYAQVHVCYRKIRRTCGIFIFLYTILPPLLRQALSRVYINKISSEDMSTILTVKYKQKELPISAEEETTLQQVKQNLYVQTKIPVNQQELFYREGQTKIVLNDNHIRLKFIKMNENSLNLKSLGMQVKWEHVFYIQYLGPIIIFPLFYLLGKKSLYTPVQTIALFMVILHFLKRQFETAYVHVFSRQYMPFMRVLVNTCHYWIVFGLLNAYQLYFYPSRHTYSSNTIIVLVALWVTFELLNYKCHKILGNFRKIPKLKAEDQQTHLKNVRQIPYGYGFGFVSCANYLWQALGWIVFSILTRNYTAYLFTVLSIMQMAQWAKKKHIRYCNEFKEAYPKGRKAMVPFIY